MFVLDALGSKAHGYVAKPASEGKFPALIQLQYAGVYALNARGAAQRAAEGWLFINVDSHDKLPSDASGNIPRNYQAVGNTDREKSYFLNMYLRDSRALDYLLTRPDWDGKTIVLTGGSMGGQQSLVLAGLRPEKITAVLVCVPAGADANGDLHGRKAGYPNWPPDNPDVMKTALYFDTVNFASRIKAPVMAGMGFIDTISPPAGVWTALNQIPGPKEPLPMIESEHDNLTPQKGRACPARTREMLDLLVKGGEFQPNGHQAMKKEISHAIAVRRRSLLHHCRNGLLPARPAPYYEDTNNVPVSPEVHADRTVTFRLFAPKASEVVLMGSPGILEVIKKPMPLAAGRQGRMESDGGPAASGLLHLRVRDRWRSANARSLESQPRGAPLGAHQPLHRARRREGGHRRTPRAARDRSTWSSTIPPNLDTERMVYVYTPPGYETGKTEVSGALSAARQRADRSILDLDRPRQRDPGQPSRRRQGQTDGRGDALRPRAARDQDRVSRRPGQ